MSKNIPTAELLFELGVEALPPKLVSSLEAQWHTKLQQALLAERIPEEYCTDSMNGIRVMVGPRRFTFFAKLPLFIPPRIEEVVGPPIPKNIPLAQIMDSKMARGFAKNNSVTPQQLQSKNNRLVAIKKTPKKSTVSAVIASLHTSLAMLSFPRTMRWGEYLPPHTPATKEFIRPVRWVVLVWNKKTVKENFFGVSSGNKTYGHHLRHPKPITCTSIAQYEKQLLAKEVILDRKQRRGVIEKALRRHAIVPSENLIDEVVNMVEFPQPINATFDKRYLETLPAMLISQVLQSHQRYFPIPNKNSFIVVVNGKYNSQEIAAIRTGNQKVVAPRLADAEFFLTKDIQQKDILCRKSLVSEKTKRVSALFELQEIKKLQLDSSVTLCDVYAKAQAPLYGATAAEFPEVISDISTKLFANDLKSYSGSVQYTKPTQETDSLPSGASGASGASGGSGNGAYGLLLALCDKLDSLIVLANKNQLATAEGDPYGSKRLAVAIGRLLSEGAQQWEPLSTVSLWNILNTRELIKNAQVSELIYRFILNHHGYLVSRQGGSRFDILPNRKLFDETGAWSYWYLYRSVMSIGRSITAASTAEWQSLKEVYKRLANITKMKPIPIDKPFADEPFDDEVFSVAARQMDRAFNVSGSKEQKLDTELRKKIVWLYNLDLNREKIENRATVPANMKFMEVFLAALQDEIKPLLATYFDSVYVMCGGEVQEMRLMLLARLRWVIEREINVARI